MNFEEMYIKHCKKIEEHVSTWKDLYDGLRTCVEIFLKEPSRDNGVTALFCLYSFVIALENLPEEGDAVNIAKEMIRLQVLEPEKIGLKIIDVSDLDVALKDFVALFAKPDVSTKKVLH